MDCNQKNVSRDKTMKLEDLGYTKKWVDYGLLTEEILADQISEFQEGEDQNLEHYRYGTFKSWLERKGEFTNSEISQFVELALEDSDQLMAGSAVKELFTHPNISDNQFILIKTLLPRFGNWTLKLIQREELKRRIENELLTEGLVRACIDYRQLFNENSLIELIIDKAEGIEILNLFTENDFGKGIRNRALEKIRRIKK
jgi:hypothetical protein